MILRRRANARFDKQFNHSRIRPASKSKQTDFRLLDGRLTAPGRLRLVGSFSGSSGIILTHPATLSMSFMGYGASPEPLLGPEGHGRDARIARARGKEVAAHEGNGLHGHRPEAQRGPPDQAGAGLGHPLPPRAALVHDAADGDMRLPGPRFEREAVGLERSRHARLELAHLGAALGDADPERARMLEARKGAQPAKSHGEGRDAQDSLLEGGHDLGELLLGLITQEA